MTRKEFVKNLLDKGATEEEVIRALLVGDKEGGVKPVKGKNVKEARKFAELVYKRIKKELNF